MSNPNTINLIRTKTSSSPQIEAIESSLRRSSYILLSSVLVVSVVLGSLYVLFLNEKQNLQAEQNELTNEITQQKAKEAAFVAIKERVLLVDKVMGTQRPWSKLLDIIALFANPINLTHVSVEDNTKAVITMKNISVDEILGISQALMNQVIENRVNNPQLLSLQLNKDGLLDVSLSFFPIF
jgi:sensor histidine kinase regulating citrate/malate metabolism